MKKIGVLFGLKYSSKYGVNYLKRIQKLESLKLYSLYLYSIKN